MKPNKKDTTVKTPPIQQTTRLIPAWIPALICALVAFVIYANTLGHQFTVDDGTVIGSNIITKKGVSAIPEIFTSSYRKGFWDRHEGLYRPLSVAMFAIEWQIAPDSPVPGHIINVLLYMLTAFLLFMTLAAIFKDDTLIIPLIATLLFVVHPLHTEVIANIKSRDEILCFLFCLGTLYNVQKYRDSNKIVSLILAAFCYFLAFLSKESAITFLPVIPLVMWFTGENKIPALLKTTLPFIIVTALYFVVRLAVLGEMKGSAELQIINNSMLGATNFPDRLATAIYVMGRYLYLLVIPYPLAFDYSYSQIPVKSFSDPVVIITSALLLYFIYFSIKGLINKNLYALGILYFFITISLVSNFLFLIESTMAERFVYLPSLGFTIVVALLVSKLYSKGKKSSEINLANILKSKPLITSTLGIILVLYSFRTISRNSDWKDNLTLLAKDVQTCPNSARIRYAYGSALLIEKALKEEDPSRKQALLDKSIEHLERGVSILPSYGEAWYHLGMAYKEKNDPAKAIPAFEKAREYKKFNDADFYLTSGLAYGMGGKVNEAIKDFTRAIELDPKNNEAYNNKGLYFTEKGQIDSAMIFLDKALQLKPDFYQAIYNKGNAYAKMNDFPHAIEMYKKALEVKPGYMDALLNLGNSYAASKDYKNALVYFKEVEKQDPNNAKMLYNIGITYNILGDTLNGNKYIRNATLLQQGK